MTPALRWRIMTLQVVLILALAFCAGFLFWGSAFINGQIHDQLAAQKIYFPAASSSEVQALPSSDASAMRQYAGQQLTTGPQAEVYADHFLAVHIREIAGGQTYAQVSAASLANPSNAKLAAQAQLLFRGETLRGLLLNAYGWSQLAFYAFWAGVGLAIGAFVVLGALLFELFVARPKPTDTTR